MKPFFISSRINVLIPLFFLGLNIFLRSRDIITRDVSLDEPFSIYHAQFNPREIVTFLSNYNNPPLYELILHYWIKLFGIEPLAIRVLPALFSVFASVSLYFLGKKHFSLLTGITAALILSFSNLSQSYAHDCRVYSLFLLLSILSMNVFLSLIKTSSRRYLLLFTLISTLNIYAHYFAIILLALQGLSVILFYRKSLKSFIVCSSFIFILFFPHIFVLVERFTRSASNGTWVKQPEGIESLYNMLWSFCNQPLTTVFAIVLFIVSIVLIKRSEPEMKCILLWFIIPVFGIFAMSFKIPMYLDRYLIFSAPAFYLLLASVPEQLVQSTRIRITFSAVIVMAFLFSFQTYSWAERKAGAAISYVKQRHSNGSIVIINPSEFIETFSYHYKKEYFKSIRSNSEYMLLDSLLKSDRIFLMNNVSGIEGKHLSSEKIIYFEYNSQSETPSFMKKFSETKIQESDTVFKNGYRIMIFRNKSATPL